MYTANKRSIIELLRIEDKAVVIIHSVWWWY